MVHTSPGKITIQVLEDHGKVILAVSLYSPQWGEPISSCLDLSLLSGFLASHASSPILCSRGRWIIHPAPAKFLLFLLYRYRSSKQSITKKPKKTCSVGCEALGAAPSTFHIAHYQLQLRCAFLSLAISLSGLPLHRRWRHAKSTMKHSSI